MRPSFLLRFRLGYPEFVLSTNKFFWLGAYDCLRAFNSLTLGASFWHTALVLLSGSLIWQWINEMVRIDTCRVRFTTYSNP